MIPMTKKFEQLIRGRRFVGESSLSIGLQLRFDPADPHAIKARFPLGMVEHRRFVIALDLLARAAISGDQTALGEKRTDFRDYILITPTLGDEFDCDSAEGLMLEIGIEGFGQHKIWLPLDKVTEFVLGITAHKTGADVAACELDGMFA